jgi:hypothetical protein
MLAKMFDPKEQKVTRNFSKLHSVIYDLYTSPNITVDPSGRAV